MNSNNSIFLIYEHVICQTIKKTIKLYQSFKEIKGMINTKFKIVGCQWEEKRFVKKRQMWKLLNVLAVFCFFTWLSGLFF
jgi:hypothetical protein